MDIGTYQKWVRDFDRERGWDLCLPAEVFVHFLEEAGEIARLVLALEGYREVTPAEAEELRPRLAEEIADAITFLIKLAYLYEVDVAGGLARNMAKCGGRYPSAEAPGAVLTYLRRHREELEQFLRQYRERFGEETE
ncbi:MAG: MazG-like family protein [Bacillota bacterium]|nr:MazG-like family protein [Bacillota bacterium]